MKTIFKNKTAIVLLFAALIFLPREIFAQSVNSRFTTSFYSWERFFSESSSERHLRIYQTAQITIGQLASNRLSFHVFGQASQDVAQDVNDDPIPRLYNAYFQWREPKGILNQIKLGRQRLYSGVAYGTIDGVDVTLGVGKYFDIGGFVGFLVPVFSNDIEVADWETSHTFGFRASSNQILGSRVLVSFMQRNQSPVAYTRPGRYTQRILTFESLAQRLIGIDIYRNFTNKVGLYGRFDYDLEQERVRRGQVELSVTPLTKWEITGEFFHRAPLIDANSIFTVFDQSTTQDVGLRVNYQIRQSWFIGGNVGALLYDGDHTVRFGLNLRSKYGIVGYNFRRGYGGQNNGIYATVNYPLTPQWGLLASTGFSRYSVFDDDFDQNTSLTGSLGLNYRPGRHFSVDVLGQGLRNRFLSNDFRLFARANYWFFAKN